MSCNFSKEREINQQKEPQIQQQYNPHTTGENANRIDTVNYAYTREAYEDLLYDLKMQKAKYEETLNALATLEANYHTLENQKKILATENGNLRLCSIVLIALFGSFILGLPMYLRHKKLKLKFNKLSETAKHTEWGLSLTQEFITANHISYDELERILNREKSLNTINTELYNKLREALLQQKASYSDRLLDRLTDLDSNFGKKFQQLFPECSTDELLMASMIHHKWKLADMTVIFHLNVEALRKRKTRLNYKISAKLNKEIDLDNYLASL